MEQLFSGGHIWRSCEGVCVCKKKKKTGGASLQCAPHCTDFTYSALPTELSCLPGSLISKEHHSFLQLGEKEGGGGQQLSQSWLGNATPEVYATVKKKYTSSPLSTCCPLWGAFKTIRIHHAHFRTMRCKKKGEKQKKTAPTGVRKHLKIISPTSICAVSTAKQCEHPIACAAASLWGGGEQQIWTSSLQRWRKLSMNARRSGDGRSYADHPELVSRARPGCCLSANVRHMKNKKFKNVKKKKKEAWNKTCEPTWGDSASPVWLQHSAVAFRSSAPNFY